MSSSHRGECAEPVGGQLAWIHLRTTVPTGVHTSVHTHTHTHTQQFSLNGAYHQVITHLAEAPPSSSSASSGPSLPILPTHTQGLAELSLGG